jgi:hypothetical protein
MLLRCGRCAGPLLDTIDDDSESIRWCYSCGERQYLAARPGPRPVRPPTERPKRGRRAGARKFPPALVAAFVADRQAGLPLAACCRKYGVSRATGQRMARGAYLAADAG